VESQRKLLLVRLGYPSATGPGTSRPSGAPIRATPDHSASSSRERSSATSTSSSSPRSPVPPGSFRSPRWRLLKSPPTLSAWPRSADASRRPRQLTARGAAHASGSRSTPRPATSGNDPTPRRNRPGYKKSPAMRGFFQCAREDSNLHGPISPQGPQPESTRVDGFSGVRGPQIGGFSARVGRAGRGGCCQGCCHGFGGRCRYDVGMSFDLQDGFDPAELWAEKQRSRDEDRRALESGEKTIEQLREENEVFAQLVPIARVNLAASKSLS